MVFHCNIGLVLISSALNGGPFFVFFPNGLISGLVLIPSGLNGKSLLYHVGILRMYDRFSNQGF